MRQGPHHGAQKSTRTGTSDSRTNCLKVSSFTGPAEQNGECQRQYSSYVSTDLQRNVLILHVMLSKIFDALNMEY